MGPRCRLEIGGECLLFFPSREPWAEEKTELTIPIQVVECFATAMLVFVSGQIGATLMSYGTNQIGIYIIIVNTLLLAVFIYATAPASGGHVNPMITFSTLLTGLCPLPRGESPAHTPSESSIMPLTTPQQLSTSAPKPSAAPSGAASSSACSAKTVASSSKAPAASSTRPKSRLARYFSTRPPAASPCSTSPLALASIPARHCCLDQSLARSWWPPRWL